MNGRTPRVVVIGPVFVDMAIKCRQFPSAGQTVDGSGFSCIPTGSGLNQATQAVLCDCDVHLIAKVGDDPFGLMIKENLKRHRVDIDFVYSAAAISTGIIVTMVDSLGENCSCISAGANRILGEDELACAPAEQLISDANVCLINSRLPSETVQAALRICRIHHTKTILQVEIPSFEETQGADPGLPAEFFDVDILMPCFAEKTVGLEAAAGITHKFKLFGAELVAKGAQCVVIHMDTRGSVVVDRQGSRHIEGFNVEIVDYNGSEDAFAAAFGASFAVDDPPARAARFASAASAIALSRFGGQESLPKKAEILELLLQHPD